MSEVWLKNGIFHCTVELNTKSPGLQIELLHHHTVTAMHSSGLLTKYKTKQDKTTLQVIAENFPNQISFHSIYLSCRIKDMKHFHIYLNLIRFNNLTERN